MTERETGDKSGAARAARLREQIESIVRPGKASRESPAAKPVPPSPREFVEQRMRELDKKPAK